MSCWWIRASPAIVGPLTSDAMRLTDSKSPSEVIGNPASITSTSRRASWWAISTFSSTESEIPGDCSPSRKVVSRSEEHTSELQSRQYLVCRLLLEKKQMQRAQNNIGIQ